MSESQAPSKNNGTVDNHTPEGVDITARRPSRNERKAARARTEQGRQTVTKQTDSVIEGKDKNRPTKEELAKGKGLSKEETEPRRLSLGELFAQDNIDEDPDSDDEEQPPKDIKRAIKRLKIKPEDFDNVLVDIEGGESMPFGKLRGRVSELVDLETNQTKFESHRIKTEGELLRGREELRSILQMIPADRLPQGLIDKVRTQHASMQVRERQSTLDVIPQWNNQETMEKDTAGMRKFISKWGFDSAWMDSINDHRAIKFIRDMYLRDLRIEAALSQVTTPEDSSKRGSGKGNRNVKPEQERNTNRRQRAPTNSDRLMNMFTRDK